MRKGIFYTIFTVLVIFSFFIFVQSQQNIALSQDQDVTTTVENTKIQHLLWDVSQTFIQILGITDLTFIETDDWLELQLDGPIEIERKTSELAAFETLYETTIQSKLGADIEFVSFDEYIVLSPARYVLELNNNQFEAWAPTAEILNGMNVTIYVDRNITSELETFSTDASEPRITVTFVDNESERFVFDRTLDPSDIRSLENWLLFYDGGFYRMAFGRSFGKEGALVIQDTSTAQMNITEFSINVSKNNPTTQHSVLTAGRVVYSSYETDFSSQVTIAQT